MCVDILAMTTQCYNLASHNSVLLRQSQNIGNGVTFLHITCKPIINLEFEYHPDLFTRFTTIHFAD